MAKKIAELVASICLYGRPVEHRSTVTQFGGFAALIELASAPRDLPIAVGWRQAELGEERPTLDTLTEAIWRSVSELRARGVERGGCRIFDTGGTRYVDVDLAKHVPSYGSLPWRSVAELPVMTLSADAIVAAASRSAS